jgi:ADP-ribosylglycohydrolase
MKVCSKCYKIYGFWNCRQEFVGNYSWMTDEVFYQKCKWTCEDYNKKTDMPGKEINQEKWLRFDFNELVTFCYCCGQVLLKSGSRWSVWFCDDCKKKVWELNKQLQRAVIPIGRHSIMNGVWLKNDAINNPEAIKEFVTKVSKMSANSDELLQWYSRRLSDNFKVLGCGSDAFLNDYLTKIEVAVDKSGAFKEMCDFLFGTIFSELYRSLQESDRRIYEDDKHIDVHHANRPLINELPEQMEEKESATEDHDGSRRMDEFVFRNPDGESYSNKTMCREECVSYVEDGDGVLILWISVVIKVKSINDKYKGGWDGFIQFCKENGYLLFTDNKLVIISSNYFPQLNVLLKSLKENSLQAESSPVDFYLMDDTYDSVQFYPYNKKDGWVDVYIGSSTIRTFNDYGIEVFLDESSGYAKARLKEHNWHKHRSVYSKVMEFYRLGDVMGSVFEGGSVHYRRYTFEEIKEKYLRAGFRTDESDIVDCFNNFISEYQFKGELNLLYNWIIYHTKHRAHVKYGRTYKEHFLIVGTLKASNNLTLERLFELSEDKNSFGNGCLALVYPVYHYAESLNLNMDGRLKLVTNFCRLTHAHSQAISAITLLYAVIDIAIKGGDIFDPKEYACYSGHLSQGLKNSLYAFLTGNVDLQPEDIINKYPDNIMALNTLFYALYSVKNATNMEETITNVISFNGDADSVNALALMLWGILDSRKT